MGSNTLSDKSDGDVINVADVNQYNTALKQDHVPRNASGAATDEGGSLGTSALRWLKGWFTTIGIGASASNNTIEEDGSNNLIIKRNGSTVATFDANGITQDSLQPLGQQVSSSSGSYSTTSITRVDATNLSVTITTTGRPVYIGIQGDEAASTPSYIRILNSTGGAAGVVGNIYFMKDSTDIKWTQYSVDNLANLEDVYFGDSLSMIYPVVAGTYTFKVQVKVNGTNTSINLEDMKLVVFEL